jgi:hypothetical protein
MITPVSGKVYQSKSFLFHPNIAIGGWICNEGSKGGSIEVRLTVREGVYYCSYAYQPKTPPGFYGSGHDPDPEEAISKAFDSAHEGN